MKIKDIKISRDHYCEISKNAFYLLYETGEIVDIYFIHQETPEKIQEHINKNYRRAHLDLIKSDSIQNKKQSLPKKSKTEKLIEKLSDRGLRVID